MQLQEQNFDSVTVNGNLLISHYIIQFVQGERYKHGIQYVKLKVFYLACIIFRHFLYKERNSRLLFLPIGRM